MSGFDAIVVGSGISGGWAAKELTEKGLSVLLIDRGKPLEHVIDYKNALTPIWELPHRNKLSNELKTKFPIQSREGGYPINEANADFWLEEKLQPYVQKKPFEWFRPAVHGGKSLLWGRQVYRWSDLDFEANAKDGHGTDWPIRYKDIAPWYDKVEKFIGVSAAKENLPHLPDGVFQPAMQLNCVESHLRSEMSKKYTDRILTIGRVAHLTQPTEEQKALGRASCQYRNACSLGCPYGAYFSTQSATLPAALKTGKLTQRTNAAVKQVIYDDKLNKVIGVEAIDTVSLKTEIINSKLVFLAASTIGSTQILMNSKSKRFPDGLGNDAMQLGKNLMDHHSRVGARADVEGFDDVYFYGRRANGIFVPRYRNVKTSDRPYLRGFDFQGGAGRSAAQSTEDFGAEYKLAKTKPGAWSFNFHGYGECLPYEENSMSLSQELDSLGMPIINFSASIKENELKMREEMANDAAEMLENAGFKNVKSHNQKDFPLGLSKHEMGTARMGKDPKTSVLNGYNQIWGAPNVFVVDGAAMASSGCVNPSLTYMALAARAADYAVKELKKMNL